MTTDVAPAVVAVDPRPRGSVLGTGTVLIWNDVVPEGVTRFYEWHDKEHIPERLALPGFLRGRRLRSAGHSPEWLTIYEAEDLSALVSPEYLQRLNAPTPATTETLRYFRNTSRAVCRLVHSVGSSTGGHVVTLRLDVDPAREASMLDHLRRRAFPDAMAHPGVIACHLFAADTSASFINTAESKNRAFDVPAWVVLCEASHADAAREGWRVIDSPALRALGVGIRADAAAYQLEICRLAQPATPAEDR
ncbi:MAG: hypothetical protein JSR18_01370 [Proteobacteria bacterium]|nr:hypothetical protein [Pseudomonadota bacterium]